MIPYNRRHNLRLTRGANPHDSSASRITPAERPSVYQSYFDAVCRPFTGVAPRSQDTGLWELSGLLNTEVGFATPTHLTSVKRLLALSSRWRWRPRSTA